MRRSPRTMMDATDYNGQLGPPSHRYCHRTGVVLAPSSTELSSFNGHSEVCSFSILPDQLIEFLLLISNQPLSSLPD